MPKNFHDAKKFVKAIGVSYECIDACPNDYILFKKQYADATICPVCHGVGGRVRKLGLMEDESIGSLKRWLGTSR